MSLRTRLREVTVLGVFLAVVAGAFYVEPDTYHITPPRREVDPDADSPYARRGQTAAPNDRERKHRVDLTVVFTPERLVDISWRADPGQGDDASVTGTPWRRVVFVDDGGSVTVWAYERTRRDGEKNLTCIIEVDGVEKQRHEGGSHCTAWWLVTG